MQGHGSTIAAISTALSPGGIGIVRLSGPQARQIAAQVFCSVTGRDITAAPGYTAFYGRVFDEDGEFDDAVLTVFRGPHSYTGEDVAELSCHGGLYLLRRLLRAVTARGAALALAGEFSKRAFCNGKMSLTQAEAVMDLISAQGRQAARSAYAVHEGALFRKISEVKALLVEASAHLLVWVDYPDDEIPEITQPQLAAALTQAEGGLSALLSTFDAGRLLREGVETAIVGRPNVGKSTLMNLLSGFQRSIVTEIPGTTRDVVEDTVTVGDVVLRLADTAGLRETNDVVERAGVELARGRLESAGLVLAVFDSSDALTDEDMALLTQLRGRPAVAVINKTDLPRRIDVSRIQQSVPYAVELSAASGQGLAALTETVSRALGLWQLDGASTLLANERQRDCAKRAHTAVREAAEALQDGVTFDAVGVCVDEAITALLELTGERTSEAVVDEIFSRFCVGK